MQQIHIFSLKTKNTIKGVSHRKLTHTKRIKVKEDKWRSLAIKSNQIKSNLIRNKNNFAAVDQIIKQPNNFQSKMQHQEENVAEETKASVENEQDWANFGDEDIIQHQSSVRSIDADKLPFLSDKEPLSALAAEYQSGSPILLEKIKVLGERYDAIRRTRGDGNCFFRGFMFSYLEHILETQDKAEVDRVKINVEECRKTLQNLGYIDFTFEDFFSLFLEQLDNVLPGSETSISHDELVDRCRDQSVSDYVVMFFRFVTSGEIKRRSDFFEPFILGLTNTTVEQFCKSSVEPMGEESDHVHITALSDALGVAIRVMYLDRSSCDTGGVSVNHHDFLPAAGNLPNPTSDGSTIKDPFITLLYRPGHYDILYPK
ncbi:OVARIAN TUMOR DOMAIN-containing deubiquitinating enzyme 1 [Mercurialis annua]|uniref:OVARIAN TUMOR DOMAIN-containing deubiquitinating enzyme 1 n=1 Tax=Mercurialis annua TaxID=3986 RepID=UPI00215E36BB|nr:OVARIAN TUMOR DOMAIN-containing deubiquitinating enzyme 1 [Mercurialis annua]